MSIAVTAPRRTGSLGEVFGVAFPLIMSSGIFAFKLFSDRVMMAWYSERSIAAALSAGMTSFMLVSFFMGVANYANAFVAQYSGARRHDRTGLAVWQSLLFSLAAGLVLIAVGFVVAPFFRSLGHAPELAAEEEAYFRVLMTGAVFALINSGAMCFWTGRNKTWTVVAVGFASIFLNVAFNWALIFGAEGTRHLDDAPLFLPLVGEWLNAFAARVGAPVMGVVGAGIATSGTDALSAIAFIWLFLRRKNRREYGTWPKRKFDWPLMRRMLRFGFGNGMQMLLDIGSFTVFILMMGMYPSDRFGANVSAASGIAFSVNGAAFIPMLGVGAAASILVGHGIGSRDIGYSVRAVRSSLVLIMSYMGIMCLFFEVFPEFLVSLFASGDTMNRATRELAATFLRFVGAFAIADGFFILYGNAIRGAGDTKYCMWVMGLAGWFLFAIPCVTAFWLGAHYYVLWCILVFYAFVTGIILYVRYRRGAWKTMTVIEDTGSVRRRRDGPASVRLSSPVATEEAVISLPGDRTPDGNDD